MPAWLVKASLIVWCTLLSGCAFYGAAKLLSAAGIDGEWGVLIGIAVGTSNLLMLDSSNPMRNLS